MLSWAFPEENKMLCNCTELPSISVLSDFWIIIKIQELSWSTSSHLDIGSHPSIFPSLLVLKRNKTNSFQ